MTTKHRRNHPKCFYSFLFFLSIFTGTIFLFPVPSIATETASFQINYISMEEAKELAGMQLSASGKITLLPSRSSLIVMDRQENIEKVKNILAKYDVPILRVVLNIKMTWLTVNFDPAKERKSENINGGWWKIEHKAGHPRSASTEKVYLQLNSKKRIKMGTVEPIRSEIRHWLENYGLTDSPDMALQTISTGITVNMRQINRNRAKLEITPWLRIEEDQQTARTDAGLEILTTLGTTANPIRPPSGPAPVRLNINPSISRTHTVRYIEIKDATMNIDITPERTVHAIAYEGEARTWGDAVLSKASNHRKRIMLLQLQLD